LRSSMVFSLLLAWKGIHSVRLVDRFWDEVQAFRRYQSELTYFFPFGFFLPVPHSLFD
jgi:steroid 5-alpha reductase family enzyme